MASDFKYPSCDTRIDTTITPEEREAFKGVRAEALLLFLERKGYWQACVDSIEAAERNLIRELPTIRASGLENVSEVAASRIREYSELNASCAQKLRVALGENYAANPEGSFSLAELTEIACERLDRSKALIHACADALRAVLLVDDDDSMTLAELITVAAERLRDSGASKPRKARGRGKAKK